MRSAPVRAGNLVGIVLAGVALLGARPARVASRGHDSEPDPLRHPGAGAGRLHHRRLGVRQPTGGIESAPRGGDLYIRYPDGTRRNLTQLAGFGQAGSRAAAASRCASPRCTGAARRPSSAWWSARRARSTQGTYFWQIYEVTGLGEAETPVITKVPNQPAGFNNVAPDLRHRRPHPLHVGPAAQRRRASLPAARRVRGGADGDGPLEPRSRRRATSGCSTTRRAASSRRRSTASAASSSPAGITCSATSRPTPTARPARRQANRTAPSTSPTSRPGPRASRRGPRSSRAARREDGPARRDEPRGALLNHFFPWQIREDGTEDETLNHVGRHELHDYFNRVFNDDPNVVEFISATSGRVNPNAIQNFLEIKEDPTTPGRFFGIDAPEFQTHAGGQIVRMDLPRGAHPDQIPVAYVTDRATASPRLDTRPGAGGTFGPLSQPAAALGRHAPRRPHVARPAPTRTRARAAAPVSRYRSGSSRSRRRATARSSRADAHDRDREERLVLGSGRARDVHERDALGARPGRGEGAREARGSPRRRSRRRRPRSSRRRAWTPRRSRPGSRRGISR